jgi:predicted phosphohydrolase
MKRVAWLTDIHLNFIRPEPMRLFFDEVRRHSPDAVVVSGDIAEGHSLLDYLQHLETGLALPIYFVLGNHDFYRNSIAAVREYARAYCGQSHHLRYLPALDFVELTPTTALVGHDGWADARLGDFAGSDVWLNDYLLIKEITTRNKEVLGPRLERLGDEAAAHFRRVLPPALAKYRHLLVVTHVPPFKEACWYEGRISGDYWLPHFTCKAVGDVLCEFMQVHPDCTMTVVCGHTHGRGEARILENLTVLTGGSTYGQPEVQRVLEVE